MKVRLATEHENKVMICAECQDHVDYVVSVGDDKTGQRVVFLCEKHLRTLKSKISYALGDFKNE